MYESPIAAQPSPGGQGDAITPAMVDAACNVLYANFPSGKKDYRDSCRAEARAALEAALASRQPVGQIDEAAVLRRAADVLYMWEDDPNLTGYMGDFKDACDILEVLAQNAAQPAQAVDGTSQSS
ncbi:hypothetical protein [Stenotrophomonas phage BUCT603]|nr:hypothetical protein [Stenotrophomonas phage BUCT603]